MSIGYNLANSIASKPTLGIKKNNYDSVFLDKVQSYLDDGGASLQICSPNYPPSDHIMIRIGSTNHKWREELLPSFSFSNMTYKQLSFALDYHYGGFLNLADYLSVGDIYQSNNNNQMFSISSHYINIRYYNGSKYVAGERLPGQTTIKWVIIGLNHDTLYEQFSPDRTKAAITIQTLGCISDSSSTTSSYQPSMNPSNTNAGGWGNTKLRSYFLDTFRNSIYNYSSIKPVKKDYCATYNATSTTSSNDYVFLLSYAEVFGNKSWSYKPKTNEGTQYAYFPTNSYNTTRTVKKAGWEGTGSAIAWWLRSPRGTGTGAFLRVQTDGNSGYNQADKYAAMAPAICL